uniref:FPL domain-containing protein n=1 Tax=Parastrongyloides trichosuri TaxID=131310 RepID=A0A0N4ZUZ3_PARTI
MFRRNHGEGNLRVPSNIYTVDYIRYLGDILSNHENISKTNKKVIIDALNKLTQVLVWGDQHNSAIIDFFLERQMLQQIIGILQKDYGNKVDVQILQTSNMLFTNFKNETSLYYLLSNNYVNEIITHKFDLTDEDIISNYVSFLKTLSFKLNSHTVHFFFNSLEDEFFLYTEACKLCCHKDTMVQTYARNITLFIYSIRDESMLKFIVKHSQEYFNTLVDMMADKAIDMDIFIRSAENVKANRSTLENMMFVYNDYCGYINDIFKRDNEEISNMLMQTMFNRLISPLFLVSLASLRESPTTILLCKVSSLYFLSQLIRIISDKSFIHTLLSALFFGDQNEVGTQWTKNMEGVRSLSARKKSSTSQEKVFFFAHLKSLEISNDDHSVFYGLFLLFAIYQNKCVQSDILEAAIIPCDNNSDCDGQLFECLTKIISNCAFYSSTLRSVTLELALLILRHFVMFMEPDHFMPISIITVAKDSSDKIINELQDLVFTEDSFLDFFESEYYIFEREQLKMNEISEDSSLLLNPPSNIGSLIPLAKRLPSTGEEKLRRSLYNWFQLRKFLHDLKGETETELPIIKYIQPIVEVGDRIQTEHVDLVNCTLITEKKITKNLFLVTDQFQLIFVEPQSKLGIVRYVGFLKDVKSFGITNDSKSLQIIVEDSRKNIVSKPMKNTVSSLNKEGVTLPSNLLFNGKVRFDDHIRCMTTKQRLDKGRAAARKFLIGHIADIFKIQRPSRSVQTSPYISHISRHRGSPSMYKFPGGVVVKDNTAQHDSINGSINDKTKKLPRMNIPGVEDI